MSEARYEVVRCPGCDRPRKGWSLTDGAVWTCDDCGSTLIVSGQMIRFYKGTSVLRHTEEKT